MALSIFIDITHFIAQRMYLYILEALPFYDYV